MRKLQIDIRNLTLQFNGKPILQDVSFQIFERDYLSIIGPNGAGKTSLLKCLMRIYPITSGEIFFLGKPLQEFSQKNLARLISYVPQSDGRYLPLTVLDFVLLGRYPHLHPFGSFTKEDLKIARDALEITQISHLSQRQLSTLSGGERQIAFIAAALAQGADILLLDEPTTFLDPRHEQEVYQILKQINKSMGKTIITVTHDINSAALRSDRVVILKNGTVQYVGSADKIMDNQILARAYDKPFLFTEHPLTKQRIIVPEASER